MKRTPLSGWHCAHGAKMVEYGGWAMPVQYESGILAEHLATRRSGGLFDVSHMGRFRIAGHGATGFLQRVLSNDVTAIDPGWAQYTLIPDENGAVIDDAYIYRVSVDEYLLVVNAGNLKKDWAHLSQHAVATRGVILEDRSDAVAMIAFQGPLTEAILGEMIETGSLPESRHNAFTEVVIAGADVTVARTGYTGEPVCFELFSGAEAAERLWTALYDCGRDRGIVPVGLGARDTLRLEAGMPLYGHEFGTDREGAPIPAFAVPLVRVAVSFADSKGDYVGRSALAAQSAVVEKLPGTTIESSTLLLRRIRKLALIDKGVARPGDEIRVQGKSVGWVTSGTITPYWLIDGAGEHAKITGETGRRAIALGYIDTNIKAGTRVEVIVRDRPLEAAIVATHGYSDAAPYFRPVIAARSNLSTGRKPTPVTLC